VLAKGLRNCRRALFLLGTHGFPEDLVPDAGPEFLLDVQTEVTAHIARVAQINLASAPPGLTIVHQDDREVPDHLPLMRPARAVEERLRNVRCLCAPSEWRHAGQ
jgi:hypothetical protein